MHGALSETTAPVSVEVKLNEDQLTAAKEGRLGAIDKSAGKKTNDQILVQLDDPDNGQVVLSLVLMLIILVSLLVMVIRLNIARLDAPLLITAFVCMPCSKEGSF